MNSFLILFSYFPLFIQICIPFSGYTHHQTREEANHATQNGARRSTPPPPKRRTRDMQDHPNVFGEQSGRRKEHHPGKEVDSSRVGPVTVVRVFCFLCFESEIRFKRCFFLFARSFGGAAFFRCFRVVLLSHSLHVDLVSLFIFSSLFVVLFVYLLTTTQRRRDQSSTTQKEGTEGSTGLEEEAALRQRRMWTQHHPKGGRISQHHSRGENSTTPTKSGTAAPP